ncbi:MAG: hypothetical protein DRI86_10840 [Bacteroidetes bacterium]|nr:MAG: hypothetical protein DRI86_10840 [Bacteroidota bacterium]
MDKNKHLDKISDANRGKDCIAIDDVQKYFSSIGIDMGRSAVRTRLSRWKEKGLIYRIARGKYKIASSHEFIQESDAIIRKCVKLFDSEYDDLAYSIWNTKLLNSYMNHIPINSFYVFECEKDIIESVFYLFKDNGLNAFLKPNPELMSQNVVSDKNSIIVRPLISRSPSIKVKNIQFASPEKILVDLFCDQETFYIYGGSEMNMIFLSMFRNYTINYSKMMNYAERRKRHKELLRFISEYIEPNFENII